MRKTFTIVLLLFSMQHALADTAVTVVVENINNDDAQLVISVFDSKKAWLKRPLMTEVVAAEQIRDDGTAAVTLSLPAGTYAFHVFHDLDMNGRMKTNFIGIPREPTGVSNDAKGKFGPPKFKDAAVNIENDPVTATLRLVEM